MSALFLRHNIHSWSPFLVLHCLSLPPFKTRVEAIDQGRIVFTWHRLETRISICTLRNNSLYVNRRSPSPHRTSLRLVGVQYHFPLPITSRYVGWTYDGDQLLKASWLISLVLWTESRDVGDVINETSYWKDFVESGLSSNLSLVVSRDVEILQNCVGWIRR